MNEGKKTVTGGGNAPRVEASNAETIQVGDVIMPPDAELRGWMRRHVRERNLPECALHMKVVEVYEGATDKRGRWIGIKTHYNQVWIENARANGATCTVWPFNFKARPETPWKIISKAVTQ